MINSKVHGRSTQPFFLLDAVLNSAHWLPYIEYHSHIQNKSCCCVLCLSRILHVHGWQCVCWIGNLFWVAPFLILTTDLIISYHAVVPKKLSVFIFQVEGWKITLLGDKLLNRNANSWPLIQIKLWFPSMVIQVGGFCWVILDMIFLCFHEIGY